ncbi:MAG: 4Fe-4S binding protein [Candidatus Omnitrophica bacterium]|nr:4Fe-4S binding protein [Candidatus Omnitrophota bacterium]
MGNIKFWGRRIWEKKGRFRWVVQLLMVIFLGASLFGKNFPIPRKESAAIFFRADAFLGLSSYLATGINLPGWWLSLGLAIAIFLAGNFFCYWFCPFGGVVDILWLVFRRGRWPVLWRLPAWFRHLRFGLFWVFIVASLAAFWGERIPNFAWVLDPFGLMVRGLILKGKWLFFLGLMVIFSLIFFRGWCHSFCPLGACYSLIGMAGKKMRNKKGRGSGKTQPA